METQNLVISFDYSWFLAKNLAYAECLIMKFHYRNSSSGHWSGTNSEMFSSLKLLTFAGSKYRLNRMMQVQQHSNILVYVCSTSLIQYSINYTQNNFFEYTFVSFEHTWSDYTIDTILQRRSWYIKTDRKWMSLYKWPLYNLFWPLFCHLYVHLSQYWGSDSHFEVLNGCKSEFGQKLWPQM